MISLLFLWLEEYRLLYILVILYCIFCDIKCMNFILPFTLGYDLQDGECETWLKEINHDSYFHDFGNYEFMF